MQQWDCSCIVRVAVVYVRTGRGCGTLLGVTAVSTLARRHMQAVCYRLVQGWVGQELIFFWPPLAQPLRHCSMPPLRV
jgi:hypothetical protein